MKKIFTILIMILFFSNVFAQDITYTITNVKVNGTPIANNSPIEFGSNTSITIKFYVKFVKPSALTIGSVSHVIGTQTPSGFTQLFTPESFSLGNGNVGFDATWEKTIYASDFSSTGENYLVSKIKQTTGTPPLEWESNHVPIVKEPTFTLSPTNLNLACGDTSPKNFIVTSSNIPSGATVTYVWSYPGWTLNGSTTTTSKTLQPTSGTSLPSTVSVTPYINGVAKPSMSCTVSRATFNPSTSAISGNANLCPSSASTYTISNLGTNSVSWSSSNTAVATIGTQSGSTVSVNGIANGSAVLTATLSNACGQTATKTFNVNIGVANITNNTILGGYDNVPQGAQSILNITAATGASSYIWTVLPMYSGGCSSALPSIVSNGSLSRIINWGGCTGLYRVRCQAINSCGGKYYSDKVVRVFDFANNPCPPARLSISPNPIKDNGDILLNIIDYPDLPPCDSPEFRYINNVKIFNLDSKEVFSSSYDKQKEVRISNLNLAKGYYIIHVTTVGKEILKENLLVE